MEVNFDPNWRRNYIVAAVVNAVRGIVSKSRSHKYTLIVALALVFSVAAIFILLVVLLDKVSKLQTTIESQDLSSLTSSLSSQAITAG